MERLDLSENKSLTDRGFKAITSAVPKFTQELNLSGNQVMGEVTMDNIIKNLLTTKSQLTSIRLERNLLGDRNVIKLVQEVMRFKKISELYLGGNRITSDSCLALAKLIRMKTELHYLGLQ